MSRWTECYSDCRQEEGITIGLIDAIMSIARIAAPRIKAQLENYEGSSSCNLQNALDDYQQDKDLQYLLNVNFRKEIGDSYDRWKDSLNA